ncbi:unnamed protein product [Soboliphyme baturini]|uniref:Uncharacterized protein n=1 Tax=Soboliphyme baturini TaxID=241478 RepID=A0A183ITW7_9BILA|nr:unnamed protein product [Soboliphyme baturini]
MSAPSLERPCLDFAFAIVVEATTTTVTTDYYVGLLERWSEELSQAVLMQQHSVSVNPNPVATADSTKLAQKSAKVMASAAPQYE